MLKLLARDLNEDSVREVLQTLREGSVVCFPTDTAYGLGVDPSNPAALRRLFDLKGRESSKPILLLVDSIAMARSVSLPNQTFEEVAAAFWPGPITFVTRARPGLSDILTGGTGTIGFRWPDSSIPIRLVRAFGGPITATSANRSGMSVARSVPEVIRQLGDHIDLVVDAGPFVKLETSTVLDLTCEPPAVLREGPISYKVLADFFEGGLERRPA